MAILASPVHHMVPNKQLHKKVVPRGVIAFSLTILLIIAMTAANPMPLTVRSLNIRYDNPSDPDPLEWKKRKDFVAEMIESGTHKSLDNANQSNSVADLIGLQEVERNQLRDITQFLGDEYFIVGKGRDGGSRGEHNPILVRKERFDVIDSKTLWLAPDSPSSPRKAFGARLNRIVTFVLVYDKDSARRVWMFNTHFSHLGRDIRVKQADVLSSVIESHARRYMPMQASYYDGNTLVTQVNSNFPIMEPVIVTGDFNDFVDSEVGQKLVRSEYNAPIQTKIDAIPSGIRSTPSTPSATLDPVFATPNGKCSPQFHCQIKYPMGELFSSLTDSGRVINAGAEKDSGGDDQGFETNPLTYSIDWVLHSAAFVVTRVHETQQNVNPSMHLSDIHNMLTVTFQWNHELPETPLPDQPLLLLNPMCCDFNVNRVELSELRSSDESETDRSH